MQLGDWVLAGDTTVREAAEALAGVLVSARHYLDP